MASLPKTRTQKSSKKKSDINLAFDFNLDSDDDDTKFIMPSDNKSKSRKKKSSSSSTKSPPQVVQIKQLPTAVESGSYLTTLFSSICASTLCFKFRPATPIEVKETDFEGQITQILKDGQRTAEQKVQDALDVRIQQELYLQKECDTLKKNLDDSIRLGAPRYVSIASFNALSQKQKLLEDVTQKKQLLEERHRNVNVSKDMVSTVELTKLTTQLMTKNIELSGGADAIASTVLDSSNAEEKVQDLSSLLYMPSSSSSSSVLSQAERSELEFDAYLKSFPTQTPSVTTSPYAQLPSIPNEPIPEGKYVEPVPLLSS
jgi:hypothetical protein